MPTTAGCITVVPPSGVTVSVTITTGAGGSPTTYTAQNGSSSHTFPKSVSSSTEFHVIATGPYRVVSTYNGVTVDTTDVFVSSYGAGPAVVSPLFDTTADLASLTGSSVALGIAVTDETTAITTGTAKVTFRMPYAMTLSSVRANLNTVSSSGNPAIDVNKGGVSIFSTTLTIDANEKTSVTAATPAVLSTTALADDDEITIDIDTAGTGAKGLKVWFLGTRP